MPSSTCARSRRTPGRASPASRPSGACGPPSRRARTRAASCAAPSTSCSSAGISSSVIARAAARCTADGNTSFDDCDAFTWSFGCTGRCPRRSDASERDHLVHVHVRRRARAGLEHVDRELVVVPRRRLTSSAASWIAFATRPCRGRRGGRSPVALAPLIAASAGISRASIGSPEIGKFSTARWVCAPHRASIGHPTSPIESCSIADTVDAIDAPVASTATRDTVTVDHGRLRVPGLLPLGADDTPYRLLTTDHVSTFEAGGRRFLQVEPEALTLLTSRAMLDIAHLLRPGHLAQLRAILDDPEASPNDRFVALELLKNACIAAGGVLPSCQDTGTAIVKGKKGEHVLTGGGDERGDRARHLRHLRRRQPALLADGAAHHVRGEEHRHQPAGRDRDRRRSTATRTSSCSWPRAAARPTRACCSRRRRRCSTRRRLMRWLDEKLRTLGTAACPPYHLALVIGGTSAEYTLKTAKLASARYLDTLPDDRQRARPRLPRRRARAAGARAHPGSSASARSSAASTSATTCA